MHFLNPLETLRRASRADLIRAWTIKPRDSFKGAHLAQVASVLNKQLLQTPGLHTAPCAQFSIQDVVGVKRLLWNARDPKLQDIYLKQGRYDGRRLGTFGRFAADIETLEALWQAEAKLVKLHPELHDVARDAKCREAVMWWAHHTSVKSRKALATRGGFVLPLLPERPSAIGNNAAPAAAARVDEAVKQSNACSACHYLDDAGAGKGPGKDPDAPFKEWKWDPANPVPRPWPSNSTYYIYAGPSGCCKPDRPWTQKRKITRYLDVNPPQQLEINEVCNSRGNGTCCILDECVAGTRPWAQYENCHILYNGSDVWEWHPAHRQCTKLLSGAGLPLNKWMTTSRTAFKFMGRETMGDSPDVSRNRTCLKWCDNNASGHGLQCYWMFEDGRPCKHHFPDGTDQYSDFKHTDRQVPFERVKLPDYCPPWDTKAVMPTPPDFPDQDWICTKCWMREDRCGTRKTGEGEG